MLARSSRTISPPTRQPFPKSMVWHAHRLRWFKSATGRCVRRVWASSSTNLELAPPRTIYRTFALLAFSDRVSLMSKLQQRARGHVRLGFCAQHRQHSCQSRAQPAPTVQRDLSTRFLAPRAPSVHPRSCSRSPSVSHASLASFALRPLRSRFLVVKGATLTSLGYQRARSCLPERFSHLLGPLSTCHAHWVHTVCKALSTPPSVRPAHTAQISARPPFSNAYLPREGIMREAIHQRPCRAVRDTSEKRRDWRLLNARVAATLATTAPKGASARAHSLARAAATTALSAEQA
mmetsp:Transcript_52561/g.114661  ORF Transcript_52561/g.114661 Transcript_52561/m.114661 type:complete len:292 (-) Transcript_52561:3660-4535(-)